MGVFKKFTTKGAKVGHTGGQYFRSSEGEEYVCEIQKVSFVEQRDQTVSFEAQLKILECSNPDMVGKVRNFYQPTNKDWAASNILAFTLAAHGIDPHDETAASAPTESDPDHWDKCIEAMCPESDGGKRSKDGTKIFVSCVSKLKKDKPKDSKDPKDYSDRTNFLPYME
jgi:hypothetical protein